MMQIELPFTNKQIFILPKVTKNVWLFFYNKAVKKPKGENTVQVLYIDTLFFLNFALDFLCLYLCSCFRQSKKYAWRLLLASFFGGVYAVFAVVFDLSTWAHLFLTLLLAVLICLIAFGKREGLRRFLGYVALFYFFSMFLGGAVSALYRFLEGVLTFRTSFIPKRADMILLCGLVSAGLLSFLLRLFGRSEKERYGMVLITAYGKTVGVSVLVDSGCLLSDPITGRPVIIVRLGSLSSLLPRDILTCARAGGVDMPKDPALARRCRLLSARSLGKASLLLSIRPDRVLLDIGGEKKECDALIALFEAEKHYFGGRDGLLPSSLLHN